MKWVKVTDIDTIDIPENKRYLICVEKWNGHDSEWYALTANFYKAGSDLTLRGEDNTPHYHKIDKTGFYVINDCGPRKYESIYYVRRVNYYMPIEMPEINPDEVLTIEN